ncbi:hypothetical protein [Thermoanaerobacter mathranii]|uniref:hypothetical protein n=1 Tax=Thermoanaerobacter mathranii TaxID=583357 RepID=UPI003D6BAE7E
MIKNKTVEKLKKIMFYIYSGFYLMLPVIAYADVSAEGAKLQTQIMPTIKDAAMYVGVLLIFVGLIMWAIRLIVAHGNPHKRSEALESGGWLIASAIILGLISVIFSLIISISGLTDFKAVNP